MNGGAPIPIQRFGFGVNAAAPYAMMGEWAITEGGKSYPVYYGDRIQFSTIYTDTDGTLFAMGNRSGNTGASAAVAQIKGVWYLVISTSSTYYQGYSFSFTGLNSIEGTTWVYPKTSSPSGAGSPFIAYRSQSASFVKTGAGPGAKAQEMSPQQRSQTLADNERRDEQRYLSSDRDSVNTDAVVPGNVLRAMATVLEQQQVPPQ